MPFRGQEHGVTPSTPATGTVLLYAKGDGRWYGLDDTGTEFALSSPPLPLSVANGGTGATTAAGARASLGAAASGANSDITSLSALSTPLSIGQGGTGQATATAAFNALDPLTAKGDLITNNGTNSVRRAVGTNGQVLTADSAQTDGVVWATPAAGTGALTAIEGFFTQKDDFPDSGAGAFQIGENNWNADSAGTAATVVRKAGESGHPGIITLRPGTVGTGRAAIGLGGDGVNTMVVAGGVIEHTWIIRSAQTLSAFEMLVAGMGDTLGTAGDQVNGVYFQLLGSPTPDTNWFLVTANASTRTRVDTGIAYAAGTWYVLKFTTNAAGTSIQASIAVAGGALTNAGTAITTNIPTVAISPLVKVDGIAGGTASDTDVDAWLIKQTLTTPRWT